MPKKSPKPSVAMEEVKGIIPFYLISAGLLLVIVGVVNFFLDAFDYRLYAGIILGAIVSFFNFYFLCISAESVVRGGASQNKARFNANRNFALRYIGTFVIVAFFTIINVVNFITMLAPFFIPRIYYTYKYGIKKQNK